MRAARQDLQDLLDFLFGFQFLWEKQENFFYPVILSKYFFGPLWI